MHHWHRPLGRRCGVVRLGRTKQYYVKVCPIALNGNGRACEEGWQAENSMWNLCVRSLVPSALSLLKQMLTTTWIRIRIFIRDKDSAVRQQWPKLPDRYKLQEMIMTTAGLYRSRLASEFRNMSRALLTFIRPMIKGQMNSVYTNDVSVWWASYY